jgi:hypothetical protein
MEPSGSGVCLGLRGLTDVRNGTPCHSPFGRVCGPADMEHLKRLVESEVLKPLEPGAPGRVLEAPWTMKHTVRATLPTGTLVTEQDDLDLLQVRGCETHKKYQTGGSCKLL